MVGKWIKRVLIFLAAILSMLVILILFLHTGWGKVIVHSTAERYLHEKFQTTVSIGDIDYRLPDWIRLKNVLILDRQADTLLSGGDLYLKISMLKLLSNKVEIGGIELEKISLHLRREAADSTFNYQAIVDAFSSEGEADADTSSKSAPMQLSVDHLSLKEVSFNFSDKKEKRHFSAYVKKLFCSSRDLDLQKSSFGINEVVTAGIYIAVSDSSTKTQAQTVASPTQTYPSPFFFSLKKLGIRDVSFSYKSISDKLDMNIALDTLQVDDASLDMAGQSFAAKRILLNNSAFNYTAWIQTKAPKEEIVPQATTYSKWKLHIDAVALSNNSATFHNMATPSATSFDPDHLDIKKINFFSRQNKLEENDVFAIIDSCSLVMNDRFDLKQFRTKLGFTGNSLQTADLFVAFNQSYITADGKLDLPSAIATNKTTTPQQYHLKNATISYADVLFFAPSLKNKLPVALSPLDKIIVSGNFSGPLQDFSVQNLNLSTNNKLLQLKGQANFQSKGRNKMKYDVVLDQLTLQKSLLSPPLLKKLQKQDIHLPAMVSLSGNLNGSAENITTDIKMNSDYGQLLLKGSAVNISSMQRLNYSLDLDIRNLETGKWIGRQTTLGKLDGKIHIKGVGIEPGKMNTSGNIQLRSLVMNGYKYENIQLTGGLINNDFTAKGFINDPNLGAEIDLRGNLSHKYPSVNGSIAVERADLKKLQLSEDSILLSGRLMIDAAPTNTGGLMAHIRADSNSILKNGNAFFVDSISITGYLEKNESNVVVNAPFINATLQTNYELTQLADNINHLQQQLFNLEDVQKTKSTDQILSVNATVTQHELLSSWLPALKLEQPLTITAQYNGAEKDSFLFLKVTAPSLLYKNVNLEGLSVKLESIDSAIALRCDAEKIRSGTDTLLHPSITGRLQNKLLTVAARIEDDEGKEYFALKASAEKAGETTVFRFLDDLTINRRKWQVPANNSVVLQKEGIVINDLSIANAGQVLYIKTRDTTATSPVDIKIDSIDIGHLASIASFGDTTFADGKLSAAVSIQQPINSWTAITGTINLNDLVFQKVPVGDLQLHTNISGDSLRINGHVTGNNRINFNSDVHLADGGLYATANLEKIDMALVQQFAKDFLSRCSGSIKGDFRFTGNINNPQINGAIKFDSTAFAMKELNALYRINGQQLKLDFPEIKFDRFTISDSLNNRLTIDGAINMSNPAELGLGLQAQTKNFIVLNAPRRQGSSLYGAAIIDANIKIDGTGNEPVIDGQISINNKSRIHYLLQSGSDYTQKAKNGILFVDIDTIPALQAEIINVLQDTIFAVKKFTGMKYNLNLDLSKDAEFRIIINPAANDELVMKGEAQLNTGMDEGGDIGITGVYRLESGYYNMNNQFLREKFMLVKGSTITFNGDPFGAVADIKTEYEVQASSSGLLRVDEKEYPDVSKRLPYQVVLNIEGTLSKPELTFDIKLKDNVPGITASMRDLINDELARLRTDVSELNKQVFSLLVMSRFTVTSNDDVAGGVLDVDAAVKDGISSFLSEAMNQMADDLIKGVDIEVTMKNYETSNSDVSKTDVGVAMSKDLLKDRLQVTIGKNFSLGETNTTYQNNAQQYMPDITTAYKLSRDGRYLVKAYHRNEYSAAVEGYFAETGVSFTIEFDYNKFKELFYSSKKLQNK